MSLRYWILDASGEPVPAELREMLVWSHEHHEELILAKDRVGEAEVSTVFLPLSAFGRPTWETMIFGGPLDQHQRRYLSRKEAIAGHVNTVAELFRATNGDGACGLCRKQYADCQCNPATAPIKPGDRTGGR